MVSRSAPVTPSPQHDAGGRAGGGTTLPMGRRRLRLEALGEAERAQTEPDRGGLGAQINNLEDLFLHKNDLHYKIKPSAINHASGIY